MKECSKCCVSKALSEYYTDKQKKDEKTSVCKSCIDKVQENNRKNPKYIENFNLYQKEWQKEYRKSKQYKEYRKKEQETRKIRNTERKKKVIEILGGICACCGIEDYRFLSIDHINNDGYKDKEYRKNRPNTYLFYKVIIDGKYDVKKLQILCYNCNTAKNHYNGVCPHKI